MNTRYKKKKKVSGCFVLLEAEKKKSKGPKNAKTYQKKQQKFKSQVGEQSHCVKRCQPKPNNFDKDANGKFCSEKLEEKKDKSTEVVEPKLRDIFSMQTEASLERIDVANLTEPCDETYENGHVRVSSAMNDRDNFSMQNEASLERIDVVNLKTEPCDETYEKYMNENDRVSPAMNDVNENNFFESQSSFVSSCDANSSACSNVVVKGQSRFCFEEYNILFGALKHLTGAVCEDKYTIIGKLYAMKMRSISSKQQFFVEKLIDQIFHEALLENINKNTILYNEPVTIHLEAMNSKSESTFQSSIHEKPVKNSNNLVSTDATFNKTSYDFIIGSQTRSCFCFEKKNVINKMKELIQKRKSDKFDVLGEFYATKLRSIPKHQKFYTEKLFNDVLLYGEFGQLDSTTCLIRSFNGNHVSLKNYDFQPKAATTKSLKLTTFRTSPNEGLKTLANSAGLLLKKSSHSSSKVSKKSLSFTTSATLDLPLKRTFSKRLKMSAAELQKYKNSQHSNLSVKTLKQTYPEKRKLPTFESVTSSNLCTVKDTLVTSSCDLRSASAISNDIVELNFSISRESSPTHTIINIENQTSSSSSSPQKSSSATIQFSDPPSNSDHFINLSIKEENLSDSECNQQETKFSNSKTSKQNCSNSCLPINVSTTSSVDTNTLLSVPCPLSSANTYLQLFTPCTNSMNSTLHPHSLANTFQNHQTSALAGDSFPLTIKKEPTSDIHPPEFILPSSPPKQNDPDKNLVSNASTSSSIVVQSQLGSANPPLQVLTSCTNTLPSILQPFSSPYFFQMHQLPVTSNNSVNMSTKPNISNDSLPRESKQLNTSSEQKQSNTYLAQNVSLDSLITTNASLSVPSQFALTNPTSQIITSCTNSMPSISSSYHSPSPYIFQVLQAPAFPVQLSVPMQLSEQHPAPTQLSGQQAGPIQLNGQPTTPVQLHGQHTAPIQYVTCATNPYLMQRFLRPS